LSSNTCRAKIRIWTLGIIACTVHIPDSFVLALDAGRLLTSGPMKTCHMICHSNQSHLSQIYTGFSMLNDSGEIALSQECRVRTFLDPAKPQHLRDARGTHLLVVVNGDTRLYYDCHDSHEIDEAAALEVDRYLKRSYAADKIPGSLKHKVFPLGFNYQVLLRDADDFERQRRSEFNQGTDGSHVSYFRPTIEKMCSAPRAHEPRILFMTRAWDPFDNPDRSDEKIQERVRINDSRARCLELLRSEFGERFLGGFLQTDFAVEKYGHVLLADNAAYEKGTYVELLRRYPICIATTGLHGSIGWKMGEYVAFSKAIVSEPLQFEVPGDFKPGENYLEFDEPEQCVNAVHELLSDAALRDEMMRRNHAYYNCYLRPDAMIRRTLDIGA